MIMIMMGAAALHVGCQRGGIYVPLLHPVDHMHQHCCAPSAQAND
jgi:hypothetical protein